MKARELTKEEAALIQRWMRRDDFDNCHHECADMEMWIDLPDGERALVADVYRHRNDNEINDRRPAIIYDFNNLRCEWWQEDKSEPLIVTPGLLDPVFPYVY